MCDICDNIMDFDAKLAFLFSIKIKVLYDSIFITKHVRKSQAWWCKYVSMSIILIIIIIIIIIISLSLLSLFWLLSLSLSLTVQQTTCIGSVNELSRNRLKAIAWGNSDTVFWRTYGPPKPTVLSITAEDY